MDDHNSPTVLIIGSGLSAGSDFKLPTMQGFFDQFDKLDQDLADFLDWFYPQKSPSEYNLEEVMSYLSISSDRLPRWRNPREMPLTKDPTVLWDSLLTYTKNRLSIPNEQSCNVHQRLFRSIGPHDSILSFNYDLIADNALRTVESIVNGRPAQNTRIDKLPELLLGASVWGNAPPSLLPREQMSGFYLKLHGSLDWLRCNTPGCIHHTNIYPCSAADTGSAQYEGMPCRCCGSALRTFIVPPVANKRIGDAGRLAFLWSLALRVLRTAHRIAVIGMSFAPTDFELRWLIRQAIALRADPHYELHVVNPCEDHRRSITGSFPGTERSVYEYDSVEKFIAKGATH